MDQDERDALDAECLEHMTYEELSAYDRPTPVSPSEDELAEAMARIETEARKDEQCGYPADKPSLLLQEARQSLRSLFSQRVPPNPFGLTEEELEGVRQELRNAESVPQLTAEEATHAITRIAIVEKLRPISTDAPKESAEHVHCWHHTGYMLASLPPQWDEVCCWCGLKERRRGPMAGDPPGNHGPHISEGMP
jgi:hypothetical protein